MCTFIQYFSKLIYLQVYCIYKTIHVHLEPHLGVLHLPSSILHRQSCSSGASRWCTAFGIKCTSGASLGVLYLPTGILHMPSCTSEAPLECTAFAKQVYCRGRHVHWEPHLVYCICQQMYCRGHHAHQEPHFVVLHLPLSLMTLSWIFSAMHDCMLSMFANHQIRQQVVNEMGSQPDDYW